MQSFLSIFGWGVWIAVMGFQVYSSRKRKKYLQNIETLYKQVTDFSIGIHFSNRKCTCGSSSFEIKKIIQINELCELRCHKCSLVKSFSYDLKDFLDLLDQKDPFEDKYISSPYVRRYSVNKDDSNVIYLNSPNNNIEGKENPG